MKELLEMLKEKGLVTTFDMSPLEYEQFKADGLNNTEGNRHEEDGYHCSICKNKGYIVKVEEHEGRYHQVVCDCKCVEVRNNIMRMKRSGLKDIIKDYTFEKYEATEPWQKAIKEAAMNYSENPSGWFALCGQSGAGKTHLCTAICRKFLLSGRKVRYMLWRDEVVRLKGLVTDPYEYSKAMDEFKTVDVLYIDDLFKTGKSSDGTTLKITGADVNVAFEIINYRYNNPSLITIISSELTEDELLDVDEAIGGRIYEKATTFTIAKDRKRNYRTKKAVTL